VFNYYNNRQFMVAGWKKSDDPPYWTKPRPQYETHGGMQIRVVDSKRGPYNNDYKTALWSSNNVTVDQTTTLWKDPSRFGWEHKTAYRWNLQYSAVHRCARIRVHKAGDKVIDSGCQCNLPATGAVEGGKLGLYTFSQPAVIYSDMRYRCLDETQLDDVAHCSAHQ
jgi:syndecan 4